MRELPVLPTPRLSIRPFHPKDFEAVWDLFDAESTALTDTAARTAALTSRRRWLEWTVANYEQLALLHQPPYGDRAVVHTATGRVIGAVGLVPYVDVFQRVLAPGDLSSDLCSAEVGLFWWIHRDVRGKGYATEAAQALLQYAFETMKVCRVIATTEFENAASIRVMQKLGMEIHRNSSGIPPWMQVVGLASNPLALPRGGDHESPAEPI